MITVKSSGRLGNKLHYFLYGLYIHKLTGIYFKPEKIDGFPATYNDYSGIRYNGNVIKSSQLNINSETTFNILKNHKGCIIIDNMTGKYDIFSNYEHLLKSSLNVENEEKMKKPEHNDLVFHMRLGDYIDINWHTEKYLFMKVLNEENFDKCYIVTDDPNNPYLNDFKNKGCIVISNSVLEDFVFLKYAKKICISKSTFSWLAAIISDAETVYFPLSDNKQPYLFNPIGDQADMRPLDKNNWIII